MSWNPSISSEPSDRFSACEKIKNHYAKENMPFYKNTGPLGGKRYYWDVVGKDGLPYRLHCACTMGTLGYGEISLSVRDQAGVNRSLDGKIYRFTKSSDVNSATSMVTLEGFFGLRNYEMRLPKLKKPDSVDANKY